MRVGEKGGGSLGEFDGRLKWVGGRYKVLNQQFRVIQVMVANNTEIRRHMKGNDKKAIQYTGEKTLSRIDNSYK